MAKPHPWRELRTMKHVEVHFEDLGEQMRGASSGDVIWLDSQLLQVERRCTLAHELEHQRRRDDGCQPPRVERRVRSAAARSLLPSPHEVADALVWARLDLDAAADYLWVDVPTLSARLDRAHMHPAEVRIIQDRLARLEMWA
jgi:hypothetical protein